MSIPWVNADILFLSASHPFDSMRLDFKSHVFLRYSVCSHAHIQILNQILQYNIFKYTGSTKHWLPSAMKCSCKTIYPIVNQRSGFVDYKPKTNVAKNIHLKSIQFSNTIIMCTEILSARAGERADGERAAAFDFHAFKLQTFSSV